ncbi:MAG: hypothetical protein IJW59_02495 [Clostridia bacterium]|nr:hypothetical protein [Clostridia bacterium]
MTKEEKMSLLKFLYLNEETQTFLCNDLFQEFMSIIPKTKCICIDNIGPATRQNNFNEALVSVHNFLIKNNGYKVMIEKAFSGYEQKFLEAHLLMGYVFYIALTENKDIDIFNDKSSIFYTEGPSVLDMIY